MSSTTQPGGASQWSLLADGGLTLRVDPDVLPAARRWIPRLIGPGAPDAPSAAGAGPTIELRAAAPPVTPTPGATPVLQLGSVHARLHPDGTTVELSGQDERAGGTIDLAGLSARLQAPPAPAPSPAAELETFTLLTISAALLLSRTGRALLHAAAVVDPSGGAWLLAGDAYAGKTTTTLNLVRSGFRFISDDHVVLGREGEGGPLKVEGWPRTFHVDEGWGRGAVEGRRVDFDPARLGADRWVRSAPLAGFYFPSVAAELPTAARPLPPATALSRIIRQTPWFIADRVAAPEILELLRSACLSPAYELRVGLDSYADPTRLRNALPHPDGG